MWEVFPTVVFRHRLPGANEGEDFFWTTPVTNNSNSALSQFSKRGSSFKQLLINWGIRQVGIVGTGVKNEVVCVQCPYCETIQEAIYDDQRCDTCRKRFFLYQDE